MIPSTRSVVRKYFSSTLDQLFTKENFNFEIEILTPDNGTWASSFEPKVSCIQTAILLSWRGVSDPKLTVLSLGTVKIIIPHTIKKIQSHCQSLWDNLINSHRYINRSKFIYNKASPQRSVRLATTARAVRSAAPRLPATPGDPAPPEISVLDAASLSSHALLLTSVR